MCHRRMSGPNLQALWRQSDTIFPLFFRPLVNQKCPVFWTSYCQWSSLTTKGQKMIMPVRTSLSCWYTYILWLEKSNVEKSWTQLKKRWKRHLSRQFVMSQSYLLCCRKLQVRFCMCGEKLDVWERVNWEKCIKMAWLVCGAESTWVSTRISCRSVPSPVFIYAKCWQAVLEECWVWWKLYKLFFLLKVG